MKSTLIILLLTLYGLALLKPAMPLVDYYLKLEEYKANCRNKDRPSMHCNGQCILMQKLKAANIDLETPASPPAPVKVNLDDYPVAIISNGGNSLGLGLQTRPQISQLQCALIRTKHKSEIFHPPLA